jgi:hypothetical protein
MLTTPRSSKQAVPASHNGRKGSSFWQEEFPWDWRRQVLRFNRSSSMWLHFGSEGHAHSPNNTLTFYTTDLKSHFIL